MVEAVRGLNAYAVRRSILFSQRCPGHLEVGEGSTRILRVKEPLAADGDPIERGSDLLLPIMAIAMAMQSIVGNNVGARLYSRSDVVLRIAAATTLLYCLAVEVLLLGQGTVVGAAFVADPDVIG